jgi:mRNA interferase MazF
MTAQPYNQLEIYWIDLESTKGAETQKKRPCVILQSTLVNRASRTVIVAPILPNHKDWPFVVNVKPTKTNGLDKERHINLKQLRVVDVSRVGKKQGMLEKRYFPSIQEAIELVFGFQSGI